MEWTPENIAMLEKLRAQKLRTERIAKYFGVTPLAITSQWKKLNNNKNKRGELWTPEETEKLLSLRAEGYSNREIADMMGKFIEQIQIRLKYVTSKKEENECRYRGLRKWCAANRKKPDYSREVTIYA
jgi:hypothetical protein